MKVASIQLALPLAILAIVLGAAGRTSAAETGAVSKSELDAKIGYCEICHGHSAEGFRGYYPIPRLAGQTPDFITYSLAAFAERSRTNNIMFHVASSLSPGMQAALAAHFHALNPKPVGGAPTALAAEGKKIFETGVEPRGGGRIKACTSCHGDDAEGNQDFPRLAGQLDDYIVDKLTNWGKEFGQHPSKMDVSRIMQPIAEALTEPQIKAVAAYLSSLQSDPSRGSAQ